MFLTEHLSRRYQVFVSSTFKDLIKERDAIRNALNQNNFIVEGMELFPAANKKQWEIIKERIKKSDIYVLIIGDKYGSVAENVRELEPDLIHDDEPISYTRLEFRYAQKLKIPILAFIRKKGKKADTITNDVNVLGFINEVQHAELTTASWNNIPDLISHILSSIQDTVSNDDFVKTNGWVKVSALDQPIEPGNESVYMINKIQYSKFVSYSDRSKNPTPLYKKRLLRWSDDNIRSEKEFEVWDEYVALTTTQLSHFVSKFQHYCRTDGDALDFSSFHPFINKFEFSDVNAGWNEKLFTPTIDIPSNTYVHTTSYINGFQDGNMDMAVKANKYCERLMLVVDFTSLPDFKALFRLKSCIKRSSNGTEEPWPYSSPQNGIFVTEALSVPFDVVLKFNFEKIQ